MLYAEWAVLYEGDFESVERFIRASRNYVVLRWTALFVAIVLVVGGFIYLQAANERERTATALESLSRSGFHGSGGVVATISCT